MKKSQEKIYITKSPIQTKRLARQLAEKILKISFKKTVIIGLLGDLGSGKTTFLQGFAKGLGIKEKILSPTFVIFRKFKIQNSKFKILYHIDCYRIQRSKEILDLGFKEIISNPENIVCIEWPEKIKKILPKSAIILKFKFIDKNKREINLDRYNIKTI